MGFYEKTFDKQNYQRYLDKNDDEYWNDYVKTTRSNRMGNLGEVLEDDNPQYLPSRKDDYLISISKTEDTRVNINLSRREALILMENLKGETLVMDTARVVRSLLGDFFVYNKDVTSEDLHY